MHLRVPRKRWSSHERVERGEEEYDTAFIMGVAKQQHNNSAVMCDNASNLAHMLERICNIIQKYNCDGKDYNFNSDHEKLQL
eukprot:480446-Amphidinium_carterae.1